MKGAEKWEEQQQQHMSWGRNSAVWKQSYSSSATLPEHRTHKCDVNSKRQQGQSHRASYRKRPRSPRATRPIPVKMLQLEPTRETPHVAVKRFLQIHTAPRQRSIDCFSHAEEVKGRWRRQQDSRCFDNTPLPPLQTGTTADKITSATVLAVAPTAVYTHQINVLQSSSSSSSSSAASHRATKLSSSYVEPSHRSPCRSWAAALPNRGTTLTQSVLTDPIRRSSIPLPPS